MAGMMPANRPLPMPPGAGAPPPSGGDPAMGDDTTVGPDEGAATGEASEEEQDQYDSLVNEAYKLIYANGKVNPNILQLLDNDPKDLVAVLGEQVGENFTPIIALAATATVVMLEVVSKAGNPQPAGEVILNAGSEVLEDLADLAKKAKIHTYTQEEINQAMLHATNLYRITGTKAGLVDEAALTAEFADILNAQERGDLGKILPGIERYDREAR